MPSKLLLEGQQYKARLDATLKDGKVTTTEVRALVKEAKAGGFTEVKAYYLASWVEQNGDKFSPTAKKTLESFINGTMAKYAAVELEPNGAPASGEPALTDDDKSAGINFQKPSGTLVSGGIGFDDPVQGQVGDCYFVSSLAAVAEKHPELLQNAIKDNGNGTYTVTFQDRSSGSARPVQVTVDGSVPEKWGRPEYLSSRSGSELWPMLFEKAFAEWQGGYENIQGGMGAGAMSALTGAKPGFFAVSSNSNPNTIWNKLQDATSGGGCVVAASTAFGEAVNGVVEGHAYTVLGTEEKDGQRLVKLRNPWGEREPGSDGKDDGIFEIPVEDFIRAYAMVEFVKP